MKQIILGAFEINQVNLTSQGLWAHPQQNTYRYKELNYWIELARTLERGYFDFLFLADSYGYPLLNGEVPAVTFEQAVEVPKNDPMPLIPALAAATEDLNFIVTTSTSWEHPYANARRFATLDHLTAGRVAWNVVTTSSAVVSKLFGTTQLPHDQRYAMAQDFLDLSYRLFEGSWEDRAVLIDKAKRIYADPQFVHTVAHDGPFFKSDGYFNSEPSPQRTPVLVQAGASSTGRAFAAANAEIAFVQGKDDKMLRDQIQDLRRLAVDAGRDASSIKAISGLSVVTAPTQAEAEEKLEEYLSWINPEAARAYYAMMTGVDLSSLDPASSFSNVTTEGSRTQVERYKDISVKEAVLDFLRRGMRELILVGKPKDVADQIVAILETTDLDGFNYTPFVSPGSYEELGQMVVPELQRIGIVRSERSRGTFRERLFGTGQSRLPASHPAAKYRRDGDVKDARKAV
ncbi:NtaA/DmoA family FMN-dependent monooxygenase [Shinella sp. CPCC 100929]|uniref:NtaA/DmoA family FMN-dependent monooxygenase n=1 Tax=Shinella lacus TaxID=2654216 RepID=A0ABT1RBZ9_9HYPH|nr:NtaA/DmoA family FMN-dependent monooxygenase [Shinella lacus]MCQ4632652.1 NtaA/DmoA family FMN-dependent monooxygenase [Shinella lacus]